tara:strand:- start:184 stop:354 length:171 start_codon:yes stop_codon:yes gene_type:complete
MIKPNDKRKVHIELTVEQWMNTVKILKTPPNVWGPTGIPYQIHNQLHFKVKGLDAK